MTEAEKYRLLILENDVKNLNTAFKFGWITKQVCDKKKKKLQQEINFLLSKV